MKELLIGLITSLFRNLFFIPLAISPKKALTSFYIPFFVSLSKFDQRLGVIAAAALNKDFKNRLTDDSTIETRFGNKIVLPPSDNHFLHRAIGVYHPKSFLYQLDQFMSASKFICEAGTHLGELSIWFKHKCPDATFVGIELHPSFCDFVERSMKINEYKDFKIINGIIGPSDIETKGYCDFQSLDRYLPELNMVAPLGTDFFTNEAINQSDIELPLEKRQIIEKINLEEVFKKHKNLPDFYFLDIEGAEVYGVPAIIDLHLKRKESLPKICFEIHHYAYSGAQARALKAKLYANKYKLMSMDDRHIFCSQG